MNDLIKQIANLPPDKRKLLEQKLREKGLDLNRSMILPQSRERNIFPISFAQQRLWFLDQMEPGSPLYNIPTAVRLVGPLNFQALENSFEEILHRHEVLRTTFASVDGQPMQVIHPSLRISIPLISLEHLPAEARERESYRLAEEEASLPFDLLRGPLIRVTVLRLTPEDHIAFMTMHHIVSDGWSMEILLNELAEIYYAIAAGRRSSLPDLTIQYADYAIWHRQWLSGAVLEEQISYWKNQLGGDLPVLELPADHPRPEVPTNKGATYDFPIPAYLYEKLKLLTQQEDMTLFMALLAAFQVLLYRHSTQENICVGTPIANRTRAELEPLIGFFVNTLAIRADFSSNPTFRDFLKQVKKTLVDAYAHQDLSFETLVETLNPERSKSYNPIFQTMFVLQNETRKKIHIPGSLAMSELSVHSGTSKFDLTFMIKAGEDTDFAGQFEYSLDLFEQATIVRFAEHFVVLLNSIVANPDTPVASLPLVSQIEWDQLVYGWNQSTNHYRKNQSIPRLFEEQVDRSPDTLAVICDGKSLTYGELETLSNGLAHHLLGLGVQKDTIVGVYMRRSVEMIVALMGILKAGCAYLPLDPNYPNERLDVICQDSGIQILLTTSGMQNPWQYPQHLRVIDVLHGDWRWIEDQTHFELPTVHPDQLAYVLYTSGSTGKPKGVMIEHHCVLHLLNASEQIAPSHAPFAGTGVSSFGFDVSVWEFYSVLCYGGTLHLLQSEVTADPVLFAKYLVENHITNVYIPPGTLLDTVIQLEKYPRRISIQRTLVGVEPIKQSTLQRFLDLQPENHIINGYGPTETTICATFYVFDHAIDPDRRVPIGMPVAGYDVQVVEKSMLPAPVGVSGEIIIGGPGLARGYLHDPEMTGRKFVKHPFSQQTGKKVYRTGDLARRLPDGNIEFIGRVDHQVKIRGFRVELGEIEAAIAKHVAVKNVVVLSRDDIGAVDGQPGVRRLIAYVVPAENAAVSPVELRKFVQAKLPEYMVPAAFVIMSSFPSTVNGKIDRKALPIPGIADLSTGAEYVAPSGPVEEILSGMWSQVLGVERAGAYDNFFELGGHSLIATQIMSRIRETFQADLPLRQLFETPTIKDLAEAIGNYKNGSNHHRPSITPVERGGRLEVSFQQQRLWFINEFEPGSTLYNIPIAIRLNGDLNIMALDLALNEIVRRHEVLRSTFVMDQGKPFQVVNKDTFLPIPITDLTSLNGKQQAEEVERLTGEDAGYAFDLQKGPLMKVSLLRLGPSEHVMLMCMHHIITDGWSISIMIEELAQLYRAFLENQPSPLAELPIQYADFADWQRNWLTGDVLEEQLDFWKKQLADLPSNLDLPTDRPRPSVLTTCGASYSFSLTAELTRALKALTNQEGASLFMTLLAAFQVLLFRYTGQEDLCVGTPIANRTMAALENIIGFFVNTLVLRGDLSGQPSFREVLKRTRDVSLDAFAHQEVPFEKIVDAIQPERDMSRSPLFQVMFILQNTPLKSFHLPGLQLEQIQVSAKESMFDMTLAMEETSDGLQGAFEYNTDLFDLKTIQAMGEHFRILLEGIIRDPEQEISKLPILSDAERRKVLYEWNDTTVAYPPNCIHRLIEMQVEATPDAVAVRFQDQSLTYRKLNWKANQLANALQKAGVQAGNLVGICVERSLEMIVGLLGILKSGAAYLPLDPVYPPERLSFMIQDSGTMVVLTQEYLETNLPEESLQRIYLDTGWTSIESESGENLSSPANPNSPAYVIYTSGSTGIPKGVVVPHRCVTNHNRAVRKLYELEPSDRVLQFSTINFDSAAEEIYPALMSGATLVLRPDQQLTTVERFMQFIEDERLTKLILPTAYWHEWVGQMIASSSTLPSSLKMVSVGGEKAIPERYEDWRKIADAKVKWINTYGPTEGTIIATAYQPEPGQPLPHGKLPIGRPIDNDRIYILDKNLQPVPVGVPGELIIAGAGVANGYLNRPELTAEKFLADPFATSPNERMYRTGDLARFLEDGNIEYCGRTDNQVKIRGFRIELDEVEAALRSYADMLDAVVIAREDTPGVRRLVAYVVPQPGRQLPSADLRGYLQSRLPEYSIPSVFVPIEVLPLTPSGKVNRRALPKPEFEQIERSEEFVAPQTPQEIILAKIWGEVLGLSRVGIHDNFFELGGDSILSIQVIARANQAGLKLAPRQLFEAKNIYKLAAMAESLAATQQDQGPVTGPVPLTPIQKWFFEQENPEPHHWNQALLFETHAPIGREVLSASLRELMAHHDMLRARYSRTGEGWTQEISPHSDNVPLEWYDLSSLEPDRQTGRVEEMCASLQGSLDLTQGPVFKVAYFDLGPDTPGRLLFVFHHLVIDGVSWRILLEDLQSIYQRLAEGRPVELPAKTNSFKEWSNRLVEYAQTAQMSSEAVYWLQEAQKPRLSLPLDNPGGKNTELSARNARVELTAAETQALLQEALASYHAEINDLLLAALATAVYHWSGRAGVSIDLESHGREELFTGVDTTRTVGWFTALFPVHLELPLPPTPAESVRAIKEQLRSVPNHGIGYGLLHYLNQDPALPSQLACAQNAGISFNYLGQAGKETSEQDMLQAASESTGPVHGPGGLRANLIDVTCIVSGGKMQAEFTYSENLHHPSSVQALADCFADSLRQLIRFAREQEQPAYAPSDFPMARLNQQKLDRLMTKLNQSKGKTTK